MRLGILVVYQVAEDFSALLDLHLAQIERTTGAPYTIYGTAHRLLPALQSRLAAHPRVKICACPPTALTGGEEHAYYLEHLTREAVADGASHLVTLHVDSFPVQRGWEEALASRLSPTCPLATIERINTACLFFPREFYLTHHPTYRLTAEQRAQPEYRQFILEKQPLEHSGIGYGYAAYRAGLGWSALRDTTHAQPGTCGNIYDDLIFHLKGAIRVGEAQVTARDAAARARLRQTLGVLKAVLPAPFRQWLKRRFPQSSGLLEDYYRACLEASCRQLLADPEEVLRRLRQG